MHAAKREGSVCLITTVDLTSYLLLLLLGHPGGRKASEAACDTTPFKKIDLDDVQSQKSSQTPSVTFRRLLV